MRKRTYLVMIIVLFLSIAGIGFIFVRQLSADRSVSYDYASDVESVSSYDKVLRFAGGDDFSPFAYIDENGLPSGHDVELAFAIGRELGYRVEITLGDWEEMQKGVLDGTYDVLMTADYSSERSKVMGYTNPICLDSYVFFGKDENMSISLANISQLKIAALSGGGATENYLSPLNLLNNTTFYDSQIAAFESVVNGENDVAIAGYIYGSNIIASKEMNLVQVGDALYGTAYYYTYSLDNSTLGPAINKALASLDASGYVTDLEEKWTTHYQPNLTFTEFLNQNVQKVFIIVLVSLVLLIVIMEMVVGKIRLNRRSLLERNSLTGLFHMQSFLNHMNTILIKNPNDNFTLIRFDINNFKTFNNTHGAMVGDLLLKNIGVKLVLLKRENSDFKAIGYLGSDHYVLLVKDGKTTENVGELYQKISNVVKACYPSYLLTIKMGLCKVNDRNIDLAKYLDQALIALRSIKQDYYQRWAYFDSKIQTKMDEEKEIEAKMYKALDEGRFVPYFQPQYDYEAKKICGAEVLVRWIEEDGTIIPPFKFIPLFEKNGFIYEMDKAIWKEAMRLMASFKKEGLPIPHLSVNISRADIYHTDLIDVLKQMLNEYKLDMNDIHFEITESAYLDNSALLINIVNQLKAMGAYVEMDDFGSGYSSLSSLKDINVDLIKIDMSLVKDNTLKGKDSAILTTVITLGNKMGLDIIAEGVENENQALYLYKHGCNKMQGYLFYKPMDLKSFKELFKK